MARVGTAKRVGSTPLASRSSAIAQISSCVSAMPISCSVVVIQHTNLDAATALLAVAATLVVCGYIIQRIKKMCNMSHSYTLRRV